MAWTTPKTWAVDELVTASMLNTHLRDNLTALKAPPTAHYEVDEASDYSPAGATWEDVDSTNLELTTTTTGGDVMMGFVGSFNRTQSGVLQLDVDIDGTRWAGDDGICIDVFVGTKTIGFTVLVTGLSAGEHTFTLQWACAAGGNTYLYAGAGTMYGDVHPQFWVREVS